MIATLLLIAGAPDVPILTYLDCTINQPALVERVKVTTDEANQRVILESGSNVLRLPAAFTQDALKFMVVYGRDIQLLYTISRVDLSVTKTMIAPALVKRAAGDQSGRGKCVVSTPPARAF